MRVTIAHSKTREDAVRAVEQAVDHLFSTDLPGPFRMMPMSKQWNDSRLRFTTGVAMGFINMPVRGAIDVLDREIVIDIDLPPLLGKIISEQQLKDAVERRVRGQLEPPKPA